MAIDLVSPRTAAFEAPYTHLLVAPLILEATEAMLMMLPATFFSLHCIQRGWEKGEKGEKGCVINSHCANIKL